MARKKVEPIKGIGRDEDKLLVEKSKPLFALWRSELTLSEFKILDTYLSRIDSHKPDKRTVVFTKDELEKLLDVQKINNQDLENRLKHLMSNVVKIPDTDEKKGYRLVTLFEEASVEMGQYDIKQVKLECTQKAMKYFFNIDNIGYLRYKLRCITSITSRYSYIMFTYLEANRYRKTWEVSVDELKKILDCENVETYKQFKEFNKQVLKRVQTELFEKTECRYSYEPQKSGRFVTSIVFTIETLSDKLTESDPNQMTIEEYTARMEQEQAEPLWHEPLKKLSLTVEQMNEIYSVVVTVPEECLPDNQACHGAIDLDRFHYLDQRVKEVLRRDSQKPIRNKFAYLLKMVRQDAGLPTE